VEEILVEFNSSSVVWVFATMGTKPGVRLIWQLDTREVQTPSTEPTWCCKHTVRFQFTVIDSGSKDSFSVTSGFHSRETWCPVHPSSSQEQVNDTFRFMDLSVEDEFRCLGTPLTWGYTTSVSIQRRTQGLWLGSSGVRTLTFFENPWHHLT
jgi:hypothetical protein